MKINRFVGILVILLTITIFMPYQGWSQPLFHFSGGAQPKPGTHPPVIRNSFAVDRGQYGYIWKIYIEAEDPDGDMQTIVCTVDQPGYGHYPSDWIYLKPQYRKNFKGYIQWNTFSQKASYLREWTQITLNVSVIDKAGNESNSVVFPFTFEGGVKGQYQYKPPAPFDQGDLPRLGYVHIDLFEPAQMAGGDSLN